VASGGFPRGSSAGGLLKAGARTGALAVDVPHDRVDGATALAARVYASPAATLAGALEALLREPCGCFEQTSATTYPVVLALRYFLSKGGRPGDKGRVDKALGILAKGYTKLAGFQTTEGGFEWFGSSPAHEALTAYGVLQFYDMRHVAPGLVDEGMLRKATDWLLSRRATAATGSAKGGAADEADRPEPVFLRSAQALDSFGRAPPLTTDAYIVYALCKAGLGGRIAPEVDALAAKAGRATEASRDDPYTLALAAGALFLAGGDARRGEAVGLAARAAARQEEGGRVVGAVSSITASSGTSLDVEATAVCVLAWLEAPESFTPPLEAAARWLASACQRGSFGSTQATVLALHAIVAYDEWRAASLVPGTASLAVDGQVVATARVEPPSPQGANGGGASEGSRDGSEPIALRSAEGDRRLATPGVHRVELAFTPDAAKPKLGGGGVPPSSDFSLPFSIDASFATPLPPSGRGCAVSLATSVSAAGGAGGAGDLHEGDAGELVVELTVVAAPPLGQQAEGGGGGGGGRSESEQALGIPMTVAVVGVPGGLEVDDERLRLLRASGTVDLVERHGAAEVALYWRGLPWGATRTVALPFVAAVPGEYTGRASRAYLYYSDELKAWAPPLVVKVDEAEAT